MRNRFLALAVSAAALGLGAGPAMADDGSFGAQVAEQVAGSQQSAQSNATSTQVNDGDVTQENNSYAGSYAGNENDTTQSVGQSQSGSGGTALQEAGQLAGNHQEAVSNAESTQIKPSNRNINVRVLSPGDNGSVSQSNNSSAESKAKNSNELDQTIHQDQSGGECCPAPPKGHSNDYAKNGHSSDPCCDHGGTGIQAAGQKALNKQYADSNAESKQVKPSNSNISVRVLSEGDDGDVDQSNNSGAESAAKNDNHTSQTIDQSQSGHGCGCKGGELIQAAGQAAFNWQDAQSNAESFQYKPENKALSFRFKSYGGSGSLSQSNNSWADSFARNDNSLDQRLRQNQGGSVV
jgi:hypothetical protein